MASYTETFSRVMESDFDDATDEEREDAIKNVLQVASVSAAAVTIQPIPFVDFALIAPIQIGAVQAIGRIYGHRLDKKAVMELLATFGASIVAQNVTIAAAKFVPFLGWVVAPSMAYALTWAIGEVSNHYFKNGRGVPADELEQLFKQVYKEKRAEKTQQNKGRSSLKQRLEELNEAYEAGLLDDEEFAAKKEQLLSDF